MKGEIRPRLERALMLKGKRFWPWGEAIRGVDGSYAFFCDNLAIEALKAARDRTTFEFVDKHGDAGELMLYILSANDLTDYDISPRGCWPNREIEDLWQPLIDKWEEYARAMWGP